MSAFSSYWLLSSFWLLLPFYLFFSFPEVLCFSPLLFLLLILIQPGSNAFSREPFI